MAISAVAICNRALDLLGQPPIAAFTDASKTAAACSRAYEPSRDAVLRSYPWNSATTRVALPALATAPAWGFARQFPLPTDCLRVLDSEGDLAGVVWRREGNRILTDTTAPLRIRYIAQVTDPAQFDPMLADVIAAHIASQIAYAITGSNETAARMLALYERVHRDARAMDAREQSQDEELGADTWLNSRLAGAQTVQVSTAPATPYSAPVDADEDGYADY